MKSTWKRLILKYGSWWVGSVIGDFKYSFVSDPEFLHVSKAYRLEAAKDALNESIRRSPFWSALILLIVLTVGFAQLCMWLNVGDGNGTIGAVLGFIIGDFALGFAIYRSGIHTYRCALQKRIGEQNKPAHPTAGSVLL